MRKIKKFAAGGSSDRAQARYDHMMADIKKDYEKARAKNPDVAKAKMEQRMADAKDDLAKARGEDRSSTRAAEKAAERALSEARRTKGRSVAASETRSSLASRMEDTPTRVSVSEKVDVGPTPSLQRSAAPKREAPKREAPKREAPKSLPDFVTRRGIKDYLKDRPGDSLLTDAGRRTMQNPKPVYTGPFSRVRTPSFDEVPPMGLGDMRAKGGKIKAKSYAKGGKIDGCAVRGKTKAKRG